jgi:uncharacterized protein (TIGR00730 family)
MIERVLVFCGSSPGRRPEYAEAARQLGELLAQRGLGLVYGGASVGLMGAVADGALAAGGEVIGVIPRQLVEHEIGHSGLSELREVTTMHERKALMAELSDAVVALPGGTGTLDELFELFTWSQLGLHRMPMGLLDVAGYWQPLLSMLDHRDTLLVDRDAGPLLDALAAYRHSATDKWIDRRAAESA